MIPELAIILAVAQNAAACKLEHSVMVVQSSDYGPGWVGPSFTFKIMPSGRINLASRRWKLPDGVHEGILSSEDWERLSCLLRDQLSAEPPREVWMCPHAPLFSVTDQITSRTVSRCVSAVTDSSLRDLYSLLPALACRGKWDTFTPAPPDAHHWENAAPSPTPCK